MPHNFRLSGCSNICISIPSGAKGCLLKSCTPFKTVFKRTVGLMLNNLKRITCISICGSISSHKNKGAVVGNPLITPIMCDFQDFTPLSAMLRRCYYFGINSYSALFSVIAPLIMRDLMTPATGMVGIQH